MNTKDIPNLVAIDGPSASGKSSVGKSVCQQLNWTYLSTGTIYRTITAIILASDVSTEDESAVLKVLNECLKHLTWDDSLGILYKNLPLDQDLQALSISQAASKLATIGKLREELLPLQRKIGLESKNGIIMDGRDIGTVVFPNAPLKIFLTASTEARAKRRLKQLTEDGALINPTSLEDMIKEIESRDIRDSKRLNSPLVKATDAFEIDTSDKTLDEVSDIIVQKIKSLKIN